MVDDGTSLKTAAAKACTLAAPEVVLVDFGTRVVGTGCRFAVEKRGDKSFFVQEVK